MGSEALVERAKSGDLDAFEAILTPLVEPAHRFACALGSPLRTIDLRLRARLTGRGRLTCRPLLTGSS